MNEECLSASKEPKDHRASKSRAARRAAFSLFCTALITVAPLSDAFARGGGFGGGGFSGGMPMRGSMSGRSAGYGQSSWHPSERGPAMPPPYGRDPGRWGGTYPIGGRGPIFRGPWRYPIYGWGAPVYAQPVEPLQTVLRPSHGSSRNPIAQPKNPPPTPQTLRPRTALASSNEKRFVPDQVMFTVKGSPDVADAIGQRHHLIRLYSSPTALVGGTMNCYRIADRRSVPDVVADLESDRQITWAQPNYIYKLDGVETAPQSLAGAQYALTKMHLDEAHRVTEGDKTLVAIIDSGIDESHPDIAGAVIDRFDALGGEIKSQTHGTAMAGAISAHGALVGAAPHANILAIRAFDGNATRDAGGTTVHIVKALNWAYEHHAQVVNMSFAGAYDPLLAQAISSAHQRGMIIVAAAGNEGPNAAPAYPASDSNVIAVTATDRDDKLFSAANHGAYISLAAPGTEILSAAPSNSYQFSSGTSIAAAEISGVIALLLAEKPDLTDNTVRQILKETAHNLHGSSPEEFGAGLGDAEKAVAAVTALRAQNGKLADAKPR
jgi:hypothetical protein